MNLKQQYIAFSTIVIKEFMRFIRIWVQTVLPAMITMGLYFVIFGNLIGSQLAPIQGYNYVDYIVPGIILMAMINNSYANVVSSFFSAKFQRHIEEMLVSPMPNYLILLGVLEYLLQLLLSTMINCKMNTAKMEEIYLKLFIITFSE